MAQTAVITAATATGTGDVVVAAGATVTIGIYTSSADGLPGDARIRASIDTPSADKFVFELVPNDPVRVVNGPCTLHLYKPASAVAYGAFSET